MENLKRGLVVCGGAISGILFARLLELVFSIQDQGLIILFAAFSASQFSHLLNEKIKLNRT